MKWMKNHGGNFSQIIWNFNFSIKLKRDWCVTPYRSVALEARVFVVWESLMSSENVLLLKYNFRLFHLLLPPSTRASALCALLHFIIRIISMISLKWVPRPRVLSSHNSNRKRIVKLLTVYARAMPPRHSRVFSSARLFLSFSPRHASSWALEIALKYIFQMLPSSFPFATSLLSSLPCVLLLFSFSAHTDVSSRSSPMLMP